jgi:hypothetical protein
LFERQQERRSTQGPYKAETIIPWKQAPTNASKPKPMQIDSSSFKKLSQKEKTDDAKKTCVCIVAEKITKLEIAL